MIYDQRKTWFLDFDGTLVAQKSHRGDKDQILPGTKDFFSNVVKENDFVIITTAREGGEHKKRIDLFMKAHGLKCDMIICDLPSGPRLVINDKKPDGSKTAYSFNLERDSGIKTNIWSDHADKD
jgi:hypothetical protein